VPDDELERALGGRVAGVDEAGRGPWAGPVVAAAVILAPDRIPEGIADSKTLSRQRRACLYQAIMATASVGVGEASVEEIDSLNILAATMEAMRRAVLALPEAPDAVLIDGNRTPDLPYPAQAVVKGDARSLSIAAASIIAKVTRDGTMARLAASHPGYGWERNAGYGTAEHRAALARLGPTSHHRRSFAPIKQLLDSDLSL
jgi:ribonuclease HII